MALMELAACTPAQEPRILDPAAASASATGIGSITAVSTCVHGC